MLKIPIVDTNYWFLTDTDYTDTNILNIWTDKSVSAKLICKAEYGLALDCRDTSQQPKTEERNSRLASWAEQW